MCSAPKIKAPPPPAQFQAMQTPKDLAQSSNGSRSMRRRGFWASVMTGPGGLASAPTTTGTSGGVMGG